jgi:hypothetical protein
MMLTKHNPHIGSSFEDFSAEEGLLEDCTNATMKRLVAWQVEQAMKERGGKKASWDSRIRGGVARPPLPPREKQPHENARQALASFFRLSGDRQAICPCG